MQGVVEQQQQHLPSVHNEKQEGERAVHFAKTESRNFFFFFFSSQTAIHR